MTYKVLIPTGWKWVDLWDITKYLNKALIKVWKKPAISYIIEAYPKDTEFVITTGYFWNQIKDFLKITYPEKDMHVVEVTPFEWEWSSLLHSLLQAKDLLQTPFIYQACDTIVLDKIDISDSNRLWWYKGASSNNYAGFNVIGNVVEKIQEKWVINPDYIHIWLGYIHDYTTFWAIAQKLYDKNPNDWSLWDINVINKMIEWGSSFTVNQYKQRFDTGNVDGLNKARKEIPDSFHILNKLEESIYMYDDFVVKFFYDQKLSDKRVKRAKILKWLVPDIQGHENNFFRYKYAQGKLYSRVANTHNFKDFLERSTKNLWTPTHEVDDQKFKEVCYDFYYTKSMQRIEKLMQNHNLKDEKNIINDLEVPTIAELFSMIDWDRLCSSKQTNFHGDFILDNIIQTKDWFCLLDRRQEFGWLLQSWDMYYDLAKLNHNLTINHDIVNADKFTIEKDNTGVHVDIHRRENLVECQNVLHSFIVQKWFDLKKVKILSAIIWLNMSPLHHHPFDKFLFYFGKYKLWQAIKSTD